MPTEPNTGMELPYKGEPGYEEAKAQFPELYAQEEQGMASGQAPPAEMPGDEGPMDPAADMGGQDEMMQMAQSAPVPDKPFSVNAVKTLVKELNNALNKFSGQEIPDIDPELPSKGAKLEGALPPEIYLTLVAISETIKILGDELSKKYGFVPEEILSDADLRKVTATLKKMAKDKKVVEAMQAPVEAEEGDAMPQEQPSPPGFFDEDEQDLAANMA